eukprot:150513_1
MGKCVSSPVEEKKIDTTADEHESSIAMVPITLNHLDYKLATAIQSGLYESLSSSSIVSDPPETTSLTQSTINRSKTIQQQCTEIFDHKVNDVSNQETFTEYAPEIFSKLRQSFDISDDEYLSILTGNNSLLSFLSNSKSGQYFFFSNNSQFMIKTMSKSELDFLVQILPSYYDYMRTQKNSLIARFYGIYKLNKFRINNESKNKDISFLISNNVFYSPKNFKIIEKYDLKGSTQGRKTIIDNNNSNQILKDLNFIENDIRLEISRDNKAKIFHEQINKDCQWFEKHLIMDYSLLVGIANVDNIQECNGKYYDNKNVFCDYYGGILSDNKKQIFFIGIIDILQKYNNKKKVAGLIKGIRYEQITLSTVPPDMYANRFCQFFKDRVL